MGCYSTIDANLGVAILLFFIASTVACFGISALIDKYSHPTAKIIFQLSGLMSILVVLSMICSTIDWTPWTTDIPC